MDKQFDLWYYMNVSDSVDTMIYDHFTWLHQRLVKQKNDENEQKKRH